MPVIIMTLRVDLKSIFYLNEHDVEYCPLNICNQNFITRMKIFSKKRRNDDGYAEVRAAKK